MSPEWMDAQQPSKYSSELKMLHKLPGYKIKAVMVNRVG
jgi:hypothetical protein